MSRLQEDIANLSDERAISGLELALENQGQAIDPLRAQDAEANLR